VTAASPQAGGWQDPLPLTEPPRLSPALVWGIGISFAVHVLLLAIRFVDPEALKLPPLPQPLEVVLVNSKTKSKPVAPDVIAQANLDGGGNTDENRRAKTPLPATREPDRGEDLKRAQQRVQELEAKQRRLLEQAKAAKPTPVPPPVAEAKPEPAPDPQPRQSGAELATMALAMARLEAQISKQTDEYNKRPRKAFVGARATEHRLAQYVEDWRIKVERVGNLNYPTEARGRIYGSLQVMVAIRPDGSIDHMQVTRPSGYPILDRAAEKILNLAAPFSPFSRDILKDYNMIVITRTWTFAPGDKLFGE
jgi:protein TonB